MISQPESVDDSISDDSRDALIVLAIAAGKTREQAASAANVCERTVYRRLTDLAIQRQIRDARSIMFSQAVGRLSASATVAIDTLRELLHSDCERIRLTAAKTILEIGLTAREQIDIEARLAELEEAASATAGRYSNK